MTRDDVKKVMAAVQILWPHSPLYPNGHASLAVDVWLTMLNDLDADATLACVQSLAADGREHAPAVGLIRSRTVETVARLTGGDVPSIGQAVEEVMREISRVGRYGSPCFSHPAISTAVTQQTWSALCNSTNMDVTLAMFRRIYETHATRSQREMSLPPQARNVLNGVGIRSIEEVTGGYRGDEG